MFKARADIRIRVRKSVIRIHVGETAIETVIRIAAHQTEPSSCTTHLNQLLSKRPRFLCFFSSDIFKSFRDRSFVVLTRVRKCRSFETTATAKRKAKTLTFFHDCFCYYMFLPSLKVSFP